MGHPPLTLGEVVAKLPRPFSTLGERSPILASAIEELAVACRVNGFPVITAMVVNHDADFSACVLTGVRSWSYPPVL
jgi:hypothetical protein